MLQSLLPSFFRSDDTLRADQVGVELTLCAQAEPSRHVVPLGAYLAGDERCPFRDRVSSE